jgi:hypothetical protein
VYMITRRVWLSSPAENLRFGASSAASAEYVVKPDRDHRRLLQRALNGERRPTLTSRSEIIPARCGSKTQLFGKRKQDDASLNR